METREQSVRWRAPVRSDLGSGLRSVQPPPCPAALPLLPPPRDPERAPGMPRAADSLINSRLCGRAAGEDGQGTHWPQRPPAPHPQVGACPCVRLRAWGDAPVRGAGKRWHLGNAPGCAPGSPRGSRGSVCPGCAPCVSLAVPCVCLPVCTPRLCSGVRAALCASWWMSVRCSPSQPRRQSPLCPSPYPWGSRFLSLACPSWGPGRGL